MQLNRGALPQGKDSAVEHFHCACARWTPSAPKLPLDRIYLRDSVLQDWTSGLLPLTTNI